MAGFEAVYEEKFVPILKAHGLTESSEKGRPTPAHIFSRLFEVKTPSEAAEKREALQKDPAWQETLRELGTAFGTGGSIRHGFGLYAAPAGPGKIAPAGKGRGHWRTYDGADGLANIWVRPVFQDRNGVLWFGTESGVSRYDGRTFTTFTTQDGLADDLVSSIFQDREGNLWFGAYGGGVSRYDGETWTTFTTKDGLASNTVSSILQDREGNLWFGAGYLRGEGGVSRYDGETWITFTTKDGLAGNAVLSILQDREGNLWFGTRDGGVSRYGGETWTTFTTKDGLAGTTVSSILQDREGNLWFGTWGDGVSRYDGETWTTFATKDGLAGNNVWSILQDREGYLWFSIQGGGVSRYDGQVFATFTVEDGLGHNWVRSIVQDREGNLWFCTGGGGVSRYDSKKFTTFTTEDGLTNNNVRSIVQDREGNLWFGTVGGGVSRYDGKTFVTFTTEDGLAGNAMFSTFQDREGNLWFSTHGSGVSRYDGKTFTTFTTKDGLANNDVRSIFQDREGNLWFSTYGGGVSRYDGQRFTSFTTEDGLALNKVFSGFQDREGVLWFGTWGGGVSRYDGKIWTTFTTEDGLAHNVVISMFQDREGVLYFGTGGGVSRYDGQVFQAMTQQDGLANNGVYAIFQDQEGYLWFGTSNGLTRYRPPASSPPSVFIDAVVADQRYEGAEEVELSSVTKLIAFEFHGMSLKTRPEAMVYRYRLKDYEEAWRNTRERRVEYEDLPLGDYTFEVVAVDRDLVYSEAPATVRLRVVRDTRDEQIDELERRVRERTRELQESNKALSDANKDLFKLNRALTRERAVERVRAEVTAMKSAEDLRDVVGEMLKELSATGVDFDLCVINIIDEEAGVRRQYGATKEGGFGQSEEPIEKVSEAFRAIWKGGRPVVRPVDEGVAGRHFETRKLLGMPVDGVERPTALVDAPFAYGTLSLSTRRPGGFSEEDVALVEEFARVVALGYARYLDFQRLETQNRALENALQEKERAQRQLIQVERMAAVGELVAGSAHELNNPLGAASSLVQSIGEMLKEDTPEELMEDRGLMTENVRIALKDLNRAKEIVANLLSLSDRTRDYTEAVRVNIVADDALRLLRGTYDREKVRVVKEYGEDLPAVTGNFADLGQMGMHLVRNAVEAMGGEGTLTLRTALEAGQVVLECRDTGRGIPVEIRGEIFKPFFKTKPPAEGTGLGLYICHQIVEKHGGAIEVDSAVGKGSTFRVKLPVRR